MSYKSALKSEVSVSLEALGSLGESTAQASPSFITHNQNVQNVNEKERDAFWQKAFGCYEQAFDLAKRDVLIPLLFAAIAALDFAALFTLFLAPSPPFSNVVAPIIRAFWSDRFLHYPDNFILLPKLLGHAHLVVTAFFGVFATGVVIKKVEAHMRGEGSISLIVAARRLYKKFAGFFVAWLLSYACFAVLARGAASILPNNIFNQLLGAFALMLLFQAVTVFILPAIAVLDGGFIKRFWAGLKFGFKNMLLALIVMAPPTIALMVVFVAKLMTPFYVKFYPELVLWILMFGILVTAVVDFLVTMVASVLFLQGGDL